MSSSRRTLHWNLIRGPRAISALSIGTVFGAGLVPYAPGTMGTIVALPLAYYSADWHWAMRVLLWTSLTIAGTWAAKVLDETMGTGDNQNIVMDEVIGLGITAWTAGHDLKTLGVAFVLFRIFDVIKPPPVRQIDTWSKNKAAEGKPSSAWYGGFGVMADDIAAGFLALACILILQWLHAL